ncbi:uncharacterized protein LOC119287752 [Triticum dicoccoides]|uniref:uncharacterized protein LOC119287752 n=1 Tax=Triticum dicoccoides TaxID=85692 RepID=UPI00188FAA00|nr:uncharacterized protein LOC119287752 [Triticum dicoccoides]
MDDRIGCSGGSGRGLPRESCRDVCRSEDKGKNKKNLARDLKKIKVGRTVLFLHLQPAADAQDLLSFSNACHASDGQNPLHDDVGCSFRNCTASSSRISKQSMGWQYSMCDCFFSYARIIC